jgi:hypothetical protein
MAFSVTADQARQEQVWDNVSRSQLDEPYQIRRILTENSVRASDRRAQFIGLDAYEQAGGTVMRDLFEHDDGGWLQDVPLLDRLVTEKLKAEAETIAAEGWKWIAVAGNATDWRLRQPRCHSVSHVCARVMSEFLGRRRGGSTGTNLWAAFAILQEMAAAGEKGSLVTILCDSGDRYRSTLFDDGWLAAQGLSCADHEAQLRQFLRPASPTGRASMHDAPYGRVVNQ